MRLGTGLRSDVVTVDEEGGAYEAVAHLLRLGYTRIGMTALVFGLSGSSAWTLILT